VQYGPRIAAIIVYLYIGQFLSKKRTAQALAELFGIPLSSGTVAGITARAAADCGPGTGKTVVALHRAAYLLYTHRKKLAQRGILVIGPSATFLRYIDQVLPSLGENDVVLATIGSLFPGVEARGPESSQAARVKGDTKMAGVLAQAVADLRQVPAAPIEIKIDGTAYRLTPRMCGDARDGAEQRLDPDTGAPCRTTRPGVCSSTRWCGSWPGRVRGTSAHSANRSSGILAGSGM
jgi:hypothetical protein